MFLHLQTICEGIVCPEANGLLIASVAQLVRAADL